MVMGAHELRDQESKVSIKWVKKASQFCKTYYVKGKQVQEWYDTKEEAENAELKT